MAERRDSSVPPIEVEPRLAMDIRRAADSIWCSRRCAHFGQLVGFRDTALWEISIAVSELVANVIKYAGQGVITIEVLNEPGVGVEIVVEDEGPGIQDIDLAVIDGYSEGRMLEPDVRRDERRGLGSGLGAVHRLMDEVEISNKPDRGARVVARKWIAKAKKR
jgi:serine/threonine-protein kinase RsbT